MKRLETPIADFLLVLENGSRPAGGVSAITEGIPSVGGEHLNKNGGFSFENLRFVPTSFFESMNRGRIQKDDVLVVKDGATTGKTAYVGDDFPFDKAAINEHIFILRPDAKKLLPKFLFYFLYSPIGQSRILVNYRGAAIGGINQSFASNVEIYAPPLAEQERLVRLLDEADALRRLRARADERMSDFIPALFHEMFGDPIKPSRKWKMTSLDEIAAIERGRFSPRPRNDPKYYGGNYPFIQTGDIAKSGGILTRWSQTLNEKGIKVSRAFEPGTIVIAIVGATIGETAILGIRTYCTDSVVGIRVDTNLATPEYVEFVLRFWKPIFRAQAPATARANINLAILRPLTIPLPPLSLQREFAARVASFDRLRTLQTRSAARLGALFESMLAKAFAGEL